ncbi:MAG: phosphatase PAP2 family protein [Nocardioides sp.]
MTMAVAWCAMTLISVTVVAAGFLVVGRATGTRGIASPRLFWSSGAAVVILLVGMGLLYQVRAVAEVDGAFVESLSLARGPVLVEIARVVTTVGDVVPTMTIAAVLALLLLLRPDPGLWPLALPLLVFLELVLQFGYNAVFPVLTLSDIDAALPIDGSGSIPSGSVARLMSLFVVAAMIRRRQQADASVDHWVSIGASLVTIELVTRLLLGRHFVADIIGGVLLGTLLCLVAAALLHATSRPASTPVGDGEVV